MSALVILLCGWEHTDSTAVQTGRIFKRWQYYTRTFVCNLPRGHDGEHHWVPESNYSGRPR